MATRNFVPRADGEGGIGTSAKQWAGGFFKKLAVVAITTAVTVLTPSADANNQQPATTSWVRTQFKSILEGVLSASGVKYNIAQNGYVCLGAFFGGLILQWGKVVTANGGIQNVSIALPITVSTILTAVCSSYTSQLMNESNSGQVSDFTNKSLTLTIDNGVGVWLAICK